MAEHPVLIVDDDSAVRSSLCDLLSDYGCQLLSADCGLNALSILKQEPCELVFSDVDMPDISGFELLARAQREHLSMPFVLMSARCNQELEQAALQAGALAMLPKPVGLNAVTSITQRVFAP